MYKPQRFEGLTGEKLIETVKQEMVEHVHFKPTIGSTKKLFSNLLWIVYHQGFVDGERVMKDLKESASHASSGEEEREEN